MCYLFLGGTGWTMTTTTARILRNDKVVYILATYSASRIIWHVLYGTMDHITYNTKPGMRKDFVWIARKLYCGQRKIIKRSTLDSRLKAEPCSFWCEETSPHSKHNHPSAIIIMKSLSLSAIVVLLLVASSLGFPAPAKKNNNNDDNGSKSGYFIFIY